VDSVWGQLRLLVAGGELEGVHAVLRAEEARLARIAASSSPCAPLSAVKQAMSANTKVASDESARGKRSSVGIQLAALTPCSCARLRLRLAVICPEEVEKGSDLEVAKRSAAEMAVTVDFVVVAPSILSSLEVSLSD
jgi:hypothetical protein